MSVGDFSGVLGRGTAEKELLENLGDPYQSLSVKIRYAGLKEFQRKAKAVMEVGLIHSTQHTGTVYKGKK